MKINVTLLFVFLAVSAILVSCGPSQAALDEQATKTGAALKEQITQTAIAQAAFRTQSFVETETMKPTLTATVTPMPIMTPTPTPESLIQPLLMEIQMVSPEIGWAIDLSRAGPAIIRTEDGGETWAVATRADFTLFGAKLHAIDENTVLYTLGIFNIKEGDRPSNIVDDLKKVIHPSAEVASLEWFVLDESNIWVTVHVGLRAGGAMAMYRTQDGGLSWERLSIGSDMELSPWKIFMVNKHTGWSSHFEPFLRHDGGSDLHKNIFTTHDGGHTWNQKRLPIPNGPLVDNLDYCFSEIIQIGTPDLLQIVSKCYDDDPQLIGHWYYKSQDSGLTWRNWPMNGEVYFLSAYVGWRAINQDDGTAIVEATENGGATWNEMGSMPGQGPFQFWNETEGWTVVSDNQQVVLWITSDGGLTWEQNQMFPSGASITFLDRYHGWVYIATDDKTVLWRTTDGGESWEEIHPMISEKVLPTPVPTSTPTLAPSVGVMRSEIDGMEMVKVPAGTFWMGSPIEKVEYYKNNYNTYEDWWFDHSQPLHEVYLDDFWIDHSEVTNAMFATFLNSEGNQTEVGERWLLMDTHGGLVRKIEYSEGVWRPMDGYEELGVSAVTWYGARAYCEWVGRRLPTEAEWEKAARGVDYRKPPWPEGSFPNGASPYGVLDMLGGQREWVWDWYDSDYYSRFAAPVENPTGPASGYYRVMRDERTDKRILMEPAYDWTGGGFRCALSASDYDLSDRTFALTSFHMVSEKEGWGVDDGTIWITHDGGRTWQDVTPLEGRSKDISVESHGGFFDANHAWVVNRTGNMLAPQSCRAADMYVWYTIDGGGTWQASHPLMDDPAARYCEECLQCRAYFSMIDTQTGWLFIQSIHPNSDHSLQVFNTTDGGATWKNLRLSWCKTASSCSPVAPVWVAPKSPGWTIDMEFINDRIGWMIGYTDELDHFILTSTDGGLIWDMHTLPAPLDFPTLFNELPFCWPADLNLLTEDVAYLRLDCFNYGSVPGVDHVYSTEDGGATWKAHELPISRLEMGTQMIFFDTDHGLLLGREMWRTEDGGAIWQHINTVSWDGQFSFADPWHGWAIAVGEEGTALVYTTNGGETWQILNPFVIE